MSHLVAVYGSLKRGHFNAELLEVAEWVGEDWLFELTLYDLGMFPGAKREPSDGVLVEIYRVTDALLATLDKLEGYRADDEPGSFYIRTRIETSYGESWVYEYNRDVKPKQRIDGGNWCPDQTMV